MDFGLNERQESLKGEAQAALESSFSAQFMRDAERSSAGYPRSVWTECVRYAWPGMTVPSEFGGWGTSLLDACILLEEVGRAGATVPLVASSGLSSAILQRLPQGQLRDRCLAEIAQGMIVAPALIDEHSRNEWDAVTLPLGRDGDHFTLNGTKILVPFASSANALLITAVDEHGELAIVVVDPSNDAVSISPHHSGAGVPVSTVALSNTKVPNERMLAKGEAARTALQQGLHVGSLLATAEAIGLSETIKRLATEYVAHREAFGQPIGAFQAVAHPCADMHISNETIRLLVHQAAWLIDTGKDATEEIASTKALANELFERVANDAFCFHGAAGFAEEVDLQLFMRRIRYFCATLGETQEALERAADAAGI